MAPTDNSLSLIGLTAPSVHSEDEMARNSQPPPSTLDRQGDTLAAFIRNNSKAIASAWSSFAKTASPSGEEMTAMALRDHIGEILTFIANDLETPETEHEQAEKSHGDSRKPSKSLYAAEFHAALRLEDRFNLDQMISEYRALRASVVKLWRAENQTLKSSDLEDLTRFNEAIDQAMTESVSYYTKTIDHSRNMFLGILGHDLRSPIGAASVCAKLLAKTGSLSPTQSIQASLIARTTIRANQIITDLLDLTRAGFGSELPMTKEDMDIGLVGRDLVDEMRALNVGREITLEVAGNMMGYWDRSRMGQIFSNLIGNAMQYSPKGNPVAIILRGEADEIILSVHNEGRPIPGEVVRKIFDALARGGEEQGGSANLGLGLYITKKIVESHKGTINVTSSEEDGTRFTVRLPRH